MAERWAVSNGNWSATGTWNGGTLPGAGDDVHANNFTVTINQDITVLSLRTTAGSTPVAGGVFTAQSGYTITANVIAGTTSCVSHAGVGTLAVVGNLTGGAGAFIFGLTNTAGGTVNITGNATGGSAGTAAGANNNSTGTINITGNVTGGSNATAYGAINTGAGAVNIYGEARGTTSNSGAPGFANSANGAAFVQVPVANNYPNDSITTAAIGTTQPAGTGAITIDAMVFGSGGVVPCAGRHYVRNAGTNYVTMRESNAGATLSMGELAADFPAASNVRSGVSYDAGNRVGTCAVPAAGSVAFGVAVDNTTGTAALDAGAIAAAVLSAAQTTPIHANVKEMNSATVYGTGIAGDLWRGSV